MDNNPSFSLSLFLPINREGSGHENASAGIEQNVRERKKRKFLPYLKGELVSCRRIRAG